MTRTNADSKAPDSSAKSNGIDSKRKEYAKDDTFKHADIGSVMPLGQGEDSKTAVQSKNEDNARADADESEGVNGNGSDTPLDEEKLKAAIAAEGMEREVKHLYLGKEGADGAEHEWVDEMPMAMSMKASAMSAKQREHSKFAVLVRMELRPKARFTEDNPVQIHSLVIQSPLLRQVLSKVFEDHASFNAAEDQPVFEKPLSPFVHRWAQLQEAVRSEEDPETKAHLDLLMAAITPELKGTLATRDLCIQRNSITFSELWMIFEPGKLVVTVVDKTECAYKINKAEAMKNERGCWFVLDCTCTDWDGETFGKASVALAISRYTGSAKISDLDIIPLDVHQNREVLVETLMRRGERFQELATVKCMVYRGTAIDRSCPTEPKKLYVDGRIVIDSDSYIRFNPGEDVTITPLNPTSEKYEERNFWRRYHKNSSFAQFDKKEVSNRDALTTQQLLTCRHLVRGFSLKLKAWLDFQIEGVEEVAWNDTAFERLILPGEVKNLLLAFAKGQRDSNEDFDDIIEGKGKGMIIQLNGPPGVGKTLTAEAVAETMRVPLYSISAGDLGLQPENVQLGLANAFQLARNWSAVLLLDEADVFMEKRATHDLARNQLVSLFLQSLEYYQGTLFLTTNRVETFDPAFESRVHVSIHYNELSPDSRREVWKNFLKIPALKRKVTSKEENISDEDVEEFVQVDLNGRQIKNVVKSASLLALSEKGPLRAEHVRTVLRIKKAEKIMV